MVKNENLSKCNFIRSGYKKAFICDIFCIKETLQSSIYSGSTVFTDQSIPVHGGSH